MSLYTDGVQLGSSTRMKLDERATLLAGLPLFAGVSKRHLRALARLTHSVSVEAGTALFTEGSPSTEAYVIVAGTAEVRSGGRRIAALGPGEVVGELGLLLDRPRNATARAVTSLDCLALGRAHLQAAVEESPELGWKLLQTVATRLSARA